MFAYMFSFLTSNNSVSLSWPLEGLFEWTRRLSKALNLITYVVAGTSKILGHLQVCWLGTKVPGYCPKTTEANLGFVFSKIKKHALNTN